ncbi:MAG: aldolase/citrate lyase family protein [Pseudomonadota bacterium]
MKKSSGNKFRRQLVSDGVSLGMWVSLSDPASAEIASASGFDWLLVDMEHTTLDLAAISHFVRALHGSDTALVVRPPQNDASMTKRLLDIGVESLLIPFVETAGDALNAVRASLYPPSGVRGFTSTSRANQFGFDDNYASRANDDVAVILQIETKKGLTALDQVICTNYIAGIFIGIADLSMDLGFGGDSSHPEIVAIAADTAQKLHSMDIPCGTLSSDAKAVRSFADAGMRFIAVGGDMRLLENSMTAAKSKFQTLLTQS